MEIGKLWTRSDESRSRISFGQTFGRKIPYIRNQAADRQMIGTARGCVTLELYGWLQECLISEMFESGWQIFKVVRIIVFKETQFMV